MANGFFGKWKSYKMTYIGADGRTEPYSKMSILFNPDGTGKMKVSLVSQKFGWWEQGARAVCKGSGLSTLSLNCYFESGSLVVETGNFRYYCN